MGFGRSHPTNILQPLIDQAKSEIQTYGRPVKKTLLDLAERRAQHPYHPAEIFGWHSTEENREATKLLKRWYGFKHLVNTRPDRIDATLVLIEAEKQILADDVADQLEVF